MFWVAQGLGVLICIVSGISYLSKRKETYLAEQLLVNVLYGTQYLMLGSFAGAISNAVSLIKYVVFYHNAKKGRQNPLWQVFFFCALSVVLGLFALGEWYTWVPIITSVIFTYAIWQDNPIVLRAIVIVCNVMWIVFNIAVAAYVSALYSFVELMFALVTMCQLLKRRTKE